MAEIAWDLLGHQAVAGLLQEVRPLMPLPGEGLSQNLENNPMQSSRRSEGHNALHQALDLSGKSPADFHHCAIRGRAASPACGSRVFAAGGRRGIPDSVSSPA